jgi:hypothetical protein
MSKLHTHVAQSTEPDDANFLALGDAPVAHGRVCCDPGAEERRGSGEIALRRDTQDKAVVHDDALGVATIGDASEVLVREVVGEGHVPAELLKASLALVTGPVGIDHAADRGEVAGRELRDCGADFGDTADDLMARDAGVDSGHDPAPLVTDLMEIGVADTAEEDFDLYVVFSGIAPRNRGGGKRRCRTGSGVSLRLVYRYLVHTFNKYATGAIRYARYAIEQNRHSGISSWKLSYRYVSLSSLALKTTDGVSLLFERIILEFSGPEEFQPFRLETGDLIAVLSGYRVQKPLSWARTEKSIFLGL